jgi:hypothetical protein
MLVMEQNYHRRMLEGTWNPKQNKADKERIIALETTISELKATPTEEKRGNRTNNKSEDLWAWKKVAPKAGQKQSKRHGKKDYHWCPKHKLWCLHRPEECQRPEDAVIANETVTADDEDSKTSVSTIRNDPILQSLVGTGRVFA